MPKRRKPNGLAEAAEMAVLGAEARKALRETLRPLRLALEALEEVGGDPRAAAAELAERRGISRDDAIEAIAGLPYVEKTLRRMAAEMDDSARDAWGEAAEAGDPDAADIVEMIEELDALIPLLEELAARQEPAGDAAGEPADEGGALSPDEQREVRAIVAALGVGEEEAARMVRRGDWSALAPAREED
ncbi:MAG: hypothetical protein RDU83_06225 [bacterium]|nr:hypothetical protein [bacterium]